MTKTTEQTAGVTAGETVPALCPRCKVIPEVYNVGISSECKVRCFLCYFEVSSHSGQKQAIGDWNKMTIKQEIEAIEKQTEQLRAARKELEKPWPVPAEVTPGEISFDPDNHGCSHTPGYGLVDQFGNPLWVTVETLKGTGMKNVHAEANAQFIANIWNAYKNLEAATGVPAAKLASNPKWLVEMAEALRDIKSSSKTAQSFEMPKNFRSALCGTINTVDKVLSPLSKADAGRAEG